MNSNIAFASSIRVLHFFPLISSICIIDLNGPIMAFMALYLSSSDFKDCGLGFDQEVNLPDHLAFATADDVTLRFSFSCSASEIGDPDLHGNKG